MVIQESSVFDGNDCLAHCRGHCGEWDFDAVLVVERGQGRAVCGQDQRPLRKRRRLHVVGQVFEGLSKVSCARTGATDEWQRDSSGDQSGKGRDDEKETESTKGRQESTRFVVASHHHQTPAYVRGFLEALFRYSPK